MQQVEMFVYLCNCEISDEFAVNLIAVGRCSSMVDNAENLQCNLKLVKFTIKSEKSNPTNVNNILDFCYLLALHCTSAPKIINARLRRSRDQKNIN